VPLATFVAAVWRDAERIIDRYIVGRSSAVFFDFA